MPKSEAEGYINTNAHLEAKVAVLEHELVAGLARERQLMETLTAVVVRMREVPAVQGDEFAELGAQARAAMNLRSDDTPLREMIEAAKAEEREAIIAEMPGGHSVDPQWVCDMIRARGDK